MTELLLLAIFLFLIFIYIELKSIKKAKYIGLQMLAEQNSWDQDKINQIADEALKSTVKE